MKIFTINSTIWDDAYREPISETKTKERKAEDLFTYKQLKYIRNTLEEKDKPIDFGIEDTAIFTTTSSHGKRIIIMSYKRDGKMRKKTIYDGSIPRQGINKIDFENENNKRGFT